MRKVMWSMLTVLAVLACGGLAMAQEPAGKAKGDGGKAEQAKKEEPKNPAAAERQKHREEQLKEAFGGQDFDKATQILDEMIADKDLSDDDHFKAEMTEFVVLAQYKGDGAKACVLAKKIAEQKKDKPEILNLLAWTILDTAGLKHRDLDVALAIATQAADATKNEDPAILDTLARAHFEKGNIDKAVELQTKAVGKAKGNDTLPEDTKAQMKDTLERYTAKQKQDAKKGKK
jgi:hypothetical protein